MHEADDVQSMPADDELRIAGERLHVALAAGRMGAWEWNVKTGRVTWSPTLERIHGLEVGTFAGTFDAYASDIHPEDRERVFALIQGSMTGENAHDLEYRIIRPDGEVRWLEAHGRLIKNADGTPGRMLGVCMDVTERKSLELERQRLASELQHVAEFREKLLGIVAHDLKNPINAISLSAQAMLTANATPETQTRMASNIVRSTERVIRMVSDLLVFTHGKIGKGLPITLGEIDLRDIVPRVVEELELTHPGRKVSLVFTGTPRGRWDGGRIGQLVGNLVGNALKYGEGTVNVRITTDEKDLMIEVHNHGTPIEPSALDKLFLPFERATTKKEGLGLGLYIVCEIARAHQGRVDVRSTAEEGTTFTVVIPR